jgi:hypothetical protein
MLVSDGKVLLRICMIKEERDNFQRILYVDFPHKAITFQGHRDSMAYPDPSLGLLLEGEQHHDHLAPFHLGMLLHGSDLNQVLFQAFEQFTAQILMSHLPAAKPQAHLDLVSILQESDDAAKLHLIIGGIGPWCESYLLELRLFLFLRVLVLLLLLFEYVLLVIHDTANGWLCVGSDLHQVQSGFLRLSLRFLDGDDSDLLSIGGDQPDPGRRYVPIDACAFLVSDKRSSDEQVSQRSTTPYADVILIFSGISTVTNSDHLEK